MNYPHLTSAPITEAIIDIRVKADPNFIVSEFESLKPDLQMTFPKFDERRGGQLTLHFEPSGAKPPDFRDLGLQGYFFKSEDEKLIAQFRIDGFTLNKLRPYTSWEDLEPLARKLWDQYKSVAKPLEVTRCALRYINQIVINQVEIDFDEYLTVAPQVPDELPQTINGFFSRITIVDAEKEIAAHVSQVFEPQPSIKSTPIILDIDTFKNVQIFPEDNHLFDIFADLRGFKNKIFFSFLTEKTIGQFK